MIKTLIKIFKSVKLAVVLIIILAILSLIGIIFPQIPAEFTTSSDGYVWWVENVAYNIIGDITYTIEFLGFLDVFHSVLFLGTVSLLALNIVFCSIFRFKKIKAGSQKTMAMSDADFYIQGKHIFEFDNPVSLKQFGETAKNALEDHHYLVAESDSSRNIYIAGDKWRFSIWGTLLVHLSLLLLLAGVLAGIYFGFRNDAFIVVENSASDIGNDTGLSVYLESFEDEYWDDGTPKDYRSDVDIFENDKIIKSGTIRVNHPLTYNGVRIHQGYFGPAVSLNITDSDGNVIFQDNVALDGMRVNDSLHRPEGEVSLPENDYSVIILGSAVNGTDPFIGDDQIGIEFYNGDGDFIGWLLLDRNIPQQLGDLYFTYDDLQYVGFMVSKDPGAIFFWIAAFLFLSGLAMIFYFPRRQIWIRIYSVSRNKAKIWVKLSSFKELGAENESIKIIKALGLKEPGSRAEDES